MFLFAEKNHSGEKNHSAEKNSFRKNFAIPIRLGTIIMKIIMNIPKNYYENTKKLL